MLSSGRLDLGLGIGWLPEEFELAGASMARRGARAYEYVAALHALWNPDPDGLSRFSGEFYTVPPGGSSRRRSSSPARRSSWAVCPARPWSGRAGSATAG